MKAYDPTSVTNIRIQQTASNWHRKQLLTAAQLDAVNRAFPVHFYQPGIFVTVGLFCFTWLSCFFYGGLLFAFFADAGGDEMLALVFAICAVSFIIALEMGIRERKLFHSGVDNALLYAGIGSAVTAVALLFPDGDLTGYCMLVIILCAAATIRYADLLVTLVLFLTLLFMISSWLVKAEIGKALLPFAIMLLSAGMYLLVRKVESLYYLKCRQLLETVTLATFYLGGNYLVVREGNAALNKLSDSAQIPFATLFYIFTTAIPLAYIFLGLKNRDRIMLVTGLLAAALSIVTYRTYFLDLTVAKELTIAGIALTSLAALFIFILKKPRFGISDEPRELRRFDHLQSVLISQAIGQPAGEQGIKFGGGDFGGGGAGQDY